MKRTLSLLAATLLVLSVAPVASAGDGIGVYFDQAGTINCSAAPALYSVVNLYLVAKNISSTGSGISGWECSLIFEPAEDDMVAPPSYTIYNGLTNLVGAPNFIVGGPPVVYAAAMPLAKIAFLYGGGSHKVGIGPGIPSSFGSPGGAYPDIPPGPGYAAGDNPGDLRRLYASSNTPSGTPLYYWVYYLAVDGATCPGEPTGVEESSWGSVKNLFR